MSHITTPDLIEREAAEAAVTAVAIHWGITGEPAILIAVKDALRALPAAQDGAEVARLRAEISDMKRQWADDLVQRGKRHRQYMAENSALKAEIERLRAERENADQSLVDRYRDPKSGRFDFPGDVAKIVRSLDDATAAAARSDAEVERLRAERDAYKGVLTGMEFRDIDRIASYAPDTAKTLGKMTADKIKDLVAERDALKAEVERKDAEIARLREALTLADDYLTILKTPQSEPLASLNYPMRKTDRNRQVAAVRNGAREVWAIVGNILHHGMTAREAKARAALRAHEQVEG